MSGDNTAAKAEIVIVRRRMAEDAGGGKGGAWKIAYADFVTAMMAFFLVMWLLAAVNAEQRAAIFEYFRNPSLENGTAPKPALGQRGPGGASTSAVNLRGGLDAPRTANDKDIADRKQLESLMEELRKVRRVADQGAGTVTELLLVLDATTGQNGLVQAQQFTDAVELTGVVLTKLDGSAKGGIVIAIHEQLGIPVKAVGLGEGIDDLVPFDPAEFVDALFS
jgi:flagellar motor protein MotB